ncbi:FimD/PapC N-terminal domain-containing protein [Caballeronia insecticola]|uniref:Outer membrane fimbrial usher porin FUP family n=1 Tax=Caballeronia insecticola TaxID=758793 RepID=R4WKS5_9BURK|nr:FimD/PapC N-terminal domain-containing protein [Caballeronia insecticola]BAN25158.1 outer membrane fimbrial usher porin FUP family [Caballeronia insecticola]
MGVSAHAWADAPQHFAQVEFNDQFLDAGGSDKVDISRFNKGQQVLPGTYRVEAFVNELWRGKFDVEIREASPGSGEMQPCFNSDLLERVGVDLRKLSPEATAKLESAGKACLVLSDLIPSAYASFDGGEQRVDISLPQIVMFSRARGYVDPKYWDEGVPAATLQYNANVYHSSAGGYANDTQYLGVIGGLNAGPWRFRYQGNLTNSNIGGQHYQSVQTYVQRGFSDIKSQLTVGDTFTDGALFDSYGVRGVTLRELDARHTRDVQDVRTRFEQERQDVTISAPKGGTVTFSGLVAGRMLAASDVALVIATKENGPLRAALSIPSRRRGFVREGQTIRLKFDAFPYAKFGTYEAHIDSISGTTVLPASPPSPPGTPGGSDPVEETPGAKDSDGDYLAWATLRSNTFDFDGQHFAILPGMRATASIVVERRSIVEWVLAPLFRMLRG